MRWANLADAVRAYLVAVAPTSARVTTSELLAPSGMFPLRRLRQGDLEKFSPWGASPANFDDARKQALEIPSWAEPRRQKKRGRGMIRFANPLWMLLILALIGRIVLLIRDRRHRFGRFAISSMSLVTPREACARSLPESRSCSNRSPRWR